VSPGYFETLRIPIVRGRAFTDLDSQSAPGVAIVNETLAREYFGAEDPIGQRIRVEMNSQNPELEDDREREIVGVVQDTRMSFTQDPFPTLYIPYLQALDHYASNFLIAIHAQHQFAIRTTGDPEAIVTPVRRAFAETDDSVAVSAIMPMRDRLGQVAGAQQYWMRLLGIFAFLGTVLAATGIYGVISYAVEQRTHEFGIRTTLGAGPLDILRLVVWEGLFVTSIGLAIGVAGTFAATRVIANQLYGVGAMDPATIVAVVFVLLLVGLLACSIPGWRATRLDPSIALRTE
jgi:predicted permease